MKKLTSSSNIINGQEIDGGNGEEVEDNNDDDNKKIHDTIIFLCLFLFLLVHVTFYTIYLFICDKKNGWRNVKRQNICALYPFCLHHYSVDISILNFIISLRCSIFYGRFNFVPFFSLVLFLCV